MKNLNLICLFMFSFIDFRESMETHKQIGMAESTTMLWYVTWMSAI